MFGKHLGDYVNLNKDVFHTVLILVILQNEKVGEMASAILSVCVVCLGGGGVDFFSFFNAAILKVRVRVMIFY